MKKLGMQEEGVFRKHSKDSQNKWADLYWYALINPKERD